MFAHYKVPYPLLMLRNSFMIVESKWQQKMEKLGLTEKDFFKPENELVNQLVRRNSSQELELTKQLEDAKTVYRSVRAIAGKIDITLNQHVEALETRASRE